MAKLTIKQIAAQAGVSIGTVDRVLHKRGRVSKETEALVLEICRQNDYAQNIVGKAMAMQRKTSTVAVVVRSRDMNSFSAQIYDGLRAIESQIRDYNIIFEYRDIAAGTAEEQLDILDSLREMDLSGLIIYPMDTPEVRTALDGFSQRGIPVVLCTADVPSAKKLCFVGQDHHQDGRLMANVLTKFTRSEPLKILMLTGSLQISSHRERINGFLSYLQDWNGNYQISGLRETTRDRGEIYHTALDALNSCPDINALYLNTAEPEPCLEALAEYGRFSGIRFCFGHRLKTGPLIRSGQLDFAIAESPFAHGYRSGEALFHYLLSQEVPAADRFVFHGEILLEENSQRPPLNEQNFLRGGSK